MKQSILWWCYQHTPLTPEQLVRVAVEVGYTGIEVFDPAYFPLVRQHGLDLVAMQGHAPLDDGLNKYENADRLVAMMTERIAIAEQWHIPNLIVFSGNRNGLDDRIGAEVTASTLARVAKRAEEAGVQLVLETLNSKVDHPDYMGDSTAWCVDVVKAVNSPAVKVLYDIYHMQVMEGNVIQTIRDNIQYIGHFHTAGCPGRNEIGDTQELNYPAIVRAIIDTGYQGYLGQEFIPQGDPAQALRQAYQICNV